MKNLFNKLVLVFGLAMAGLGSAFAAADTTAITAIGADATAIGAAVFGVLVIILASKLIRRAV